MKTKALALALFALFASPAYAGSINNGGSGGGGGTTYTAGPGINITGTVISGATIPTAKSADYTVASADMGTTLTLTGAHTLTIAAIAANLFATGQSLCYVNTGTGVWTISSTPTIQGFPDTLFRVFPGGGGCFVSDGTNLVWQPGVRGVGGIYSGLYTTGNTYTPWGAYAAVAAASTPTINNYFSVNGALLDEVTITNLCVKVTGNVASSNIQIAIYTISNGKANTLIDHTASIATATTGVHCAAPSGGNLTLPAGEYAWVIEVDTAAIGFDGPAVSSAIGASLQGAVTQANAFATSSNVIGVTATGATFGTWPALTSATWSDVVTAIIPAIGFQL